MSKANAHPDTGQPIAPPAEPDTTNRPKVNGSAALPASPNLPVPAATYEADSSSYAEQQRIEKRMEERADLNRQFEFADATKRVGALFLVLMLIAPAMTFDPLLYHPVADEAVYRLTGEKMTERVVFLIASSLSLSIVGLIFIVSVFIRSVWPKILLAPVPTAFVAAIVASQAGATIWETMANQPEFVGLGLLSFFAHCAIMALGPRIMHDGFGQIYHSFGQWKDRRRLRKLYQHRLSVEREEQREAMQRVVLEQQFREKYRGPRRR